MFENIKRATVVDRKDVTLKRIVNAIMRRIVNLPQHFIFFLPFGFYKDNRKKLKQFKDKHIGERCFIICNGPSLKHIDFNLLKDEVTIGMNRIYLMKDQNGFEPTYLACVDKKSQIEQFHDDLDSLNFPCFFNFEMRKYFSKKKNQCFIEECFSPRFQTDASKLLGAGKSVTYHTIQLAFYMGFSEVYVIGKDHSYNTTEKAGVGIKATGNEENHFIKGYYKPGMNWDAPDYKTEEYNYQIARKAYEKAGRTIKDATIGGKLQVFEKVDFYSLFPRK